VTAYHFDPRTGTLAPFQTLSTLPGGFDGKNTCAKINIHPSGKFLYISNRGHDSIACFAVDGATGGLTTLGQQKTEAIPRAFNLDPTGSFLFAAGQGSGQMEAFRVNPGSGRLEPLKIYPVGKQASWVLILEYN
jgi:6-phosphogluconolactonase